MPNRESRRESGTARSMGWRKILGAACLLAFSSVWAPAVLQAQEVDDQAITKPDGPTEEATCPGGVCGETALDRAEEGVTRGGEVTGDPAADEPCTGDSCGELPKAGDLGGITKLCPDCVEPPVFPADDGGLNREGGVTEGLGGEGETEKAAAAAPAVVAAPCQGNNHTNNNFTNNISMGGPMVAMAWVPTASVTVSGIEVFTGEAAAPNRLAIWSDDGGGPAKPLAPLAWTGNFTTSLTNGWQGANLTSNVSVAAGVRYWVVWDPTGGEQASVTNTGIQQTYWGSYSGTVQGGASWFGPYSHSDHRWKFRMRCGSGPCDGNNHANTIHLDNVSMGGPVVAIAWTPAVTGTIRRIEMFTGESTAPNQVALWSNNAGLPGTALSWSNPFNATLGKGWQGADLLTPISVTAGSLYWVVWDPAGGEQAAVTNTGIQQTYYGSGTGNVMGGATWGGPYNFTDRRWKFRVFCQEGPCDGNNHQDNVHLDPVLMGGPMVGIRWVAGTTNTITGVEVFTGEVSGPNAVGIWSDSAGQPGAPLGFSNSFGTALPKSWQGAPLTGAVNVTAGQTYWVVWDPSGGEQASVTNTGIQQTYWGNGGGSVSGGGSWFGPYSFPDRRWKFRLLCGKQPCDGNNYANTYHLDNVSVGGPMIGIRWKPAATETIQRIEVYTGEVAANDAIGIWSSTGGANPQPLAALSYSNPFTTTVAKGWQGADLITPLTVTGGAEYWVVWDPAGGGQSSLTDSPGDIQQTYWGSYGGTVAGGASWFGPFSFPDRRYKFRMFCGKGFGSCGPGQCIGGSYCDSCLCYAPTSPVSVTMCQCRLLDPSCGIGECVGGSYCTGPFCPNGVCYSTTSPISLAMCGGVVPRCGIVFPPKDR